MLEGLAYAPESYSYFSFGQPPLRCSESLAGTVSKGQRVLSPTGKLPIPRLSSGSLYPSNGQQIVEDGPQQGLAAACNPATGFQHFQSLKRAHFFRSPPYGGEQLGAGNSLHIFPEPNSCYLRERTANQRMRWIEFRWRREYKAILWKHTCILYTLNKSPVHVCTPLRLCIITYHFLPIPSPLV